MLLVWQNRDRNEWATAIRESLTPETAASSPTRGPNPFSLADPAITEGILTAAGFTELSVTDVREPVYYGPDTATAFDAVLHLWESKDLLVNLDAAAAEQARMRLRATLRRPQHRQWRVLRFARLDHHSTPDLAPHTKVK